MNINVNRINPKLLILIILIIPFNQYLWNYLFKIKYFEKIAEGTNYIIQPTFIANFLAIIIFSFIIFYLGKLKLNDFFINRNKIKQGLKWTLLIWFIVQLFSLGFSYFSENKIVFTDKLNILTGSFIGQFFGNAFLEEGLYRGLILIQFYLILRLKFNEKKSIIFAIITSQLLFSLIHIPNRLLINQVDNLLANLIKLFIVGVIFSLIYLKTKNLIFLIGVHSLINMPFIINETNFPIPLIVLLVTVIISIFWNKLNKISNVKLDYEENMNSVNKST